MIAHNIVVIVVHSEMTRPTFSSAALSARRNGALAHPARASSAGPSTHLSLRGPRSTQSQVVVGRQIRTTTTLRGATARRFARGPSDEGSNSKSASPATSDGETSPDGGSMISRQWAVVRQKLSHFLPMCLLFFFMAFNNTIFDSTKDTILITAIGGAEQIPFVTLYAVLPASCLFLRQHLVKSFYT